MKRLHEHIKELVEAEIPEEGLNPGVVKNMTMNAKPIAIENMLNDLAEKIEDLENNLEYSKRWGMAMDEAIRNYPTGSKYSNKSLMNYALTIYNKKSS